MCNLSCIKNGTSSEPHFGFNFWSKNGPIFSPILGPIFSPISGPIFDQLLAKKNRRSPSFFWSKFKFLNKLHYKWGKAPICSAWTGPKSWAETRPKVVPKLDQKLYPKLDQKLNRKMPSRLIRILDNFLCTTNGTRHLIGEFTGNFQKSWFFTHNFDQNPRISEDPQLDVGFAVCSEISPASAAQRAESIPPIIKSQNALNSNFFACSGPILRGTKVKTGGKPCVLRASEPFTTSH